MYGNHVDIMAEIGILVVDSGAFIKVAPVEKWSSRVVTVKEVISEIRDEHTRRRLLVLPYKLHFQEPTQVAIQHVTNFAKKTGDYGSLSPVDIKVMALTYQLTSEQEPEKVTVFRKEPSREEQSTERVNMPGMVGFYKLKPNIDSGNEKNSIHDNLEMDNVLNSQVMNTGDLLGQESVQEDNHLSNESGIDQEEDSAGDSEDEGWITPDNIKQACAEMGGVLEEEAKGVAVGCVTTDFAMQNVLLQMGLTVISVDGLRVKQLQTYAKKCKACFKTTTNTGLVFCPHCGNKTLAKVSVTVGQDGTMHYHFLSSKQFSHRGVRYSLPLPKGGRHANNPVLAPDQKVTYKQKKLRSGKFDPLHPDYIVQSSPFAMKDVTSRGAQISFQAGSRGGKRWNPNAVRKK